MKDLFFEYLEAVDWAVFVTKAIYVVITLILARIALAAITSGVRRFEQKLVERAQTNKKTAIESSKRAETLSRLLKQGALITIWIIALFTILSQVGFDLAPLLASAGIVGLAIGFGAQNLVRDVISGFFIVLEDQIRVGDVAVVNGTGGLVEEVRLRTIILRDLSGVVHVFPNGTITTLANMTKEWSAYIFNIGVAYKEDTDRVVEVMKEVAAELRQDEYFGPLIIEDLEVFGVDAFADSAVVIKARLKTEPIKQWEVGRQYLRRLKKAFDERGIEIPYPHRSIYFGEASKPFLTRVLEQQADDASSQARAMGN